MSDETMKLELKESLESVRRLLEESDRISHEVERLSREMEDLRVRAQARFSELNDQWREALEECFRELQEQMEVEDLTPENWSLDVTYMRDHGEAFMYRNKTPGQVRDGKVDLSRMETEGSA